MARQEEPVIARHTPSGWGALAIRTIAAALAGTVGFYLSVVVAYVTSDVEMSPVEMVQSMFPAREPVIVAIVLATSALSYLAIAKSGLYRSIVGHGPEGWIAIAPTALFALIIIRAIAVDLAYSPIHYDVDWEPELYLGMISAPLLFLPYLVDGVWLFAVSLLLAKGVGED